MTTVNSLSSLSAKTGMSGLASGMDTEELVKSMTETSRQRILKQQQAVQTLQWKQTGYRSVTSSLKGFQSSYLDLLSKTNFRSTSFFNTIKANTTSSSVGVSTTSTATAGNLVINKISQLATNQKLESAAGISKGMAITIPATEAEADALLNKSISFNLDGKVKAITLDAAFVDALKTGENTNVKGELQRLLTNAFGTYDDSGITKQRITVDDNLRLLAPGSQITVNAIGEDEATLTALGLKPQQSTKLLAYKEISTLNFATPLDDSDTFKFSINGESFEFDKGTSISKIISKVNNNTKAGVTLSYSSVTDQFSITSNTSGAGENINITETQGNLLTAMGLTEESGVVETVKGKDAILTVDNQQIVRSSNTVEIDGVRIELKETTNEEINITLKHDATELKEHIKKFVEDYNAMLDLTNGLVKEKKYSDFAPLSDEQKGDMTETQIKQWEDKAKSGLLRADRILIGLASKLQSLIASSAVEGFSLYSMGIRTTGYQNNGKLEINEDTLDKVLEEKGAEIKALFTDENGLGNSMNTLIESYVKTSGSQGSRGILVEAAGIESTRSAEENNINDSIKRSNKMIETLKRRLESQESNLWKQFTAMESALNQLNSQSAILAQFSANQNS